MKTYYKAFDKDLKCRGFQYEVGKTYETKGDISICSNGFHACESPMSVLDYYPNLTDNRYAEVELSGKKETDNGKTVAQKIKIKGELNFKDFIKAHIDFIWTKTKDKDKSGDYAQIGSSGYSAQIGSSGDSAKIGSSGYHAQIGSSGDYAKIGSSGDYAKIGSSGYSAQIGSSGYYAKIGSSGDYAKIGSSGYSAKIGSSGYSAQIKSEGEKSVIAAIGYNGEISAKKGSWITLAEYDNEGIVKCVKSAMIDGKELKEDVSYKLKNGKFIKS